MSTFRYLIVMFAVLVATVAASPAATSRQQVGEEMPNILIIVTDDQRWDQMTVMPQTSRLFIEEGVSFPYAYATTPLCCPSRASILSGRYSHNHGVKRNDQARRLDPRSTMPRYLSEAGYRTALVGKYLQSLSLKKAPAFFHRWAITKFGYENRRFNIDGITRKVERYSTDVMKEMSLRYLGEFERTDERPWFLMVAPTAPHLPATPHPVDLQAEVPPMAITEAMTETDRGDKPPYVQQRSYSVEGGAEAFRRQSRSLLSVDRMVASIFAELELLDEDRLTLAFFMSDNGYLLSEHGLAGKRLPYLSSVRIPFYVRWPGRGLEGTIDERLAANIDLLPTVLEATGLEPDPAFPIDGRSLFSPTQRTELLLEQYVNKEYPDWASLITRDDQYIEYYARGQNEPQFAELYDLATDPWQLQNRLPAGLPVDPEALERASRLRVVKDCSGIDCP